MATLTLSKPVGYMGGNLQTYGPLVGNSNNLNYVLMYSFTTPEIGYISSVTFSNIFRHYTGSASRTNEIRVKVTESDSSHINAGVETTDYNASIILAGSASSTKSCAINGLWLKPNTTYYIYLFPGTQSFLKYCYDNNGKDQGSLSYDATIESYTLNIATSVGSYAAVKRTNSPSGATGALNNGAEIYNGDVLTITFGSNEGYEIKSQTVNGSYFPSGGSYVVASDVSVDFYATVRFFVLSLVPGSGSKINVIRTNSPLQGAEIGSLKNGDMIYYNDIISVTVESSAIYEIISSRLNGIEFKSGLSHTVRNDVFVETKTRMLAFVYLTVDGILKKFRIIIFNKSKWRNYRPVILHGVTNISTLGVNDAIVITTALAVKAESNTIIIGGN